MLPTMKVRFIPEYSIVRLPEPDSRVGYLTTNTNGGKPQVCVAVDRAVEVSSQAMLVVLSHPAQSARDCLSDNLIGVACPHCGDPAVPIWVDELDGLHTGVTVECPKCKCDIVFEVTTPPGTPEYGVPSEWPFSKVDSAMIRRAWRVGEIGLSEQYWDCECVENYIHHSREASCDVCGAWREDQPPSRVIEVAADARANAIAFLKERAACGGWLIPNTLEEIAVWALDEMNVQIDMARDYPNEAADRMASAAQFAELAAACLWSGAVPAALPWDQDCPKVMAIILQTESDGRPLCPECRSRMYADVEEVFKTIPLWNEKLGAFCGDFFAEESIYSETTKLWCQDCGWEVDPRQVDVMAWEWEVDNER
ncbi:MAG: hypothetical protein U9R15_05805 [Chloroflexota bacterium]|nr:hypothetical protein [Chloroflexota bacterium]